MILKDALHTDNEKDSQHKKLWEGRKFYNKVQRKLKKNIRNIYRKMIGLICYLSIITLNVYVISSPIKDTD